jgi:hypothetical protein
MAIPIPVLVVVSLIVSGCTRLNAVILGKPVSVSPLLLIAAAVLLTLAVALLWILRALLRDGLRLSPYPRTVSNWSTS